jgi:hypothetical protein
VSANTPTQGFPYPLASDRPCDYPVTMAALANALDAKGQSFDTDVARLAKRKWVKISRTSFTYDSSVITDVPFDTVENNNGTPTDLTLDPYRVQLVAGVYALQAKVIIPTSVVGTRWRVNVKDTTGTFLSPRADTNSIDFGSTIIPSTLTLMDVMYVPSGVAKASITIAGFGVPVSINYASLAAWWISDA